MNWSRKYEQLSRKIKTFLQSHANDPIWRDETFWRERWPQMIDAQAHALEMKIFQENKNNQNALAAIFCDRLSEVRDAFMASC